MKEVELLLHTLGCNKLELRAPCTFPWCHRGNCQRQNKHLPCPAAAAAGAWPSGVPSPWLCAAGPSPGLAASWPVLGPGPPWQSDGPWRSDLASANAYTGRQSLRHLGNMWIMQMWSTHGLSSACSYTSRCCHACS